MDEIILYRTPDGKSAVALYPHEGSVCLSQKQIAALFATSKQLVSYHVSNILKDNELQENSVVKDFLTTQFDPLMSGGAK